MKQKYRGARNKSMAILVQILYAKYYGIKSSFAKDLGVTPQYLNRVLGKKHVPLGIAIKVKQKIDASLSLDDLLGSHLNKKS